tara:strand:- start:5329 stop:6141 length:813 start_codon:yes stop_codon:yes gene_type:complete
MAFFKQFPKIEYDFNRDGTIQNMVDIYRSVRPLSAFLDNFSAYKFYEVKNGERPDIVSQRLYGTPDFYWTFFVVNEFLHDGYRAWPLSEENLFDYIQKEYEGFVITTSPDIVRTGDGLIINADNPTGEGFRNSLSARFTIGETITGSTSGATGTLVKKDADKQQLVIQNVTGAFIAPEEIKGQTSDDTVSSNQVFKYAEAPFYYFKTGDAKKRPITIDTHVQGGVPENESSFVSYRSQIIEENDTRAQIRYVNPEAIGQFVDKFEELLNG